MGVYTIFTEGDADNLATWSNVPYFFTKELESQGNTVNRINVEPNYLIQGIYNRVLLKLINKLYGKETTYRFKRTKMFRMYIDYRMKRAVKQYKDTDCFVSFSFSYHPKQYTNRKCVMFCDWTYEYYIKKLIGREPYTIEMDEIINQKHMIAKADYVITLFPDKADYMKHQYSTSHIHYLGNVINSEVAVLEEIIPKKFQSNEIIFIGTVKYLEGLILLIKAVETLRKQGYEIVIHVIGIDEGAIDETLRYYWMNFYGYLNKSIPDERELYYRLFDQSKLYVNPSAKWAGFSSALEAMDRYTPIITTKYSSFVSTFTEELSFGYYCNDDDVLDLSDKIKIVLDKDLAAYGLLAKNAVLNVEDFSWHHYIQKFTALLGIEKGAPDIIKDGSYKSKAIF